MTSEYNGRSVLRGTAQKGEGAATRLGFPTVNIPLSDDSLSGIYAARVVVDGRTFEAGAYANRERNILEAHLLDFSGDLYGKSVSVEICEKLREGAVFESEQALQKAIAADVQSARAYFERSGS